MFVPDTRCRGLSRPVQQRRREREGRGGVNKKLSGSTVSPPMLIPQRRKALASASAASPPPPPPPPPPAADTPLTFDASVENQPQYRLLRSFRSSVLVHLPSVAKALCIYGNLTANVLNNLWGVGLYADVYWSNHVIH